MVVTDKNCEDRANGAAGKSNRKSGDNRILGAWQSVLFSLGKRERERERVPLAGSEFMVIQRCKKIGQTSGLIFERSLSALNRATYSVSIGPIEREFFVACR